MNRIEVLFLVSVMISLQGQTADYRPTDPAEVSGGFVVQEGQRYIIDDQSIFGAAGPASALINGELAIWNVSGKLSGTWSGSGSIDIRGGQQAVSFDDYVQETYTTIVTGMNLSKLQALNGWFGGKSCPGGKEAQGFCFENNGSSAIYQLQATRMDGDREFLVGIRLTLRQKEDAVQVVVGGYPRVMYMDTDTEAVRTAGGVRLGMDMYATEFTKNNDYLSANLALSDAQGGYGCHRLVAEFGTLIELAEDNCMAPASRITAIGAENGAFDLDVSNVNALPSNGVFTVGAGTKAVLSAPGKVNKAAYAGDTCRIRVLTNGYLRTVYNTSNYAIGHNQIVDVIGGRLLIGEGASTQTGDANCYCNYINLQDGARVESPSLIRLGNKYSVDPACVWTVSGAGVSMLSGGLHLVSDSYEGEFKFRMEVDEVTGDDAPDFIVDGPVLVESEINPGTSRYDGLRVVKTGPGTVRFNGFFHPGSSVPTRIHEGALMLGASGATTSAQNFEIWGGTFAVADGTSNVVGTLKARESGRLVLGKGVELAFADSSTVSWVDGATIEIIGELGPRMLRFGTSADGLTTAQCRALRYKGRRIRLDDAGYVLPSEGLVIVFK